MNGGIKKGCWYAVPAFLTSLIEYFLTQPMMPNSSHVDPFAEFDLICDFPCAIDAFAELRRYIRAVNDFIPHVTDQQGIRITARIKRESDPVALDEMEYELETVARDGATVLPRLIWGGVLVSLFAAFEFGVRRILKHWQASVDHPNEFKVLPRKDFIKSAELYAQENIGLPLFNSQHIRQTLIDLKDFRNSFAHGSGLLSDLSINLVAAISQRIHPGVSLDIEDGQWVGNARSAAYYLLKSEKAINAFSECVLEKYLAHNRTLRHEA